jgi:hypothetical protein
MKGRRRKRWMVSFDRGRDGRRDGRGTRRDGKREGRKTRRDGRRS